MATQYTPILQLALPVTGELNGTWGDVVNDNITSMVEEAIAGLATISTWTANSHTLTTADGTTDEARCAMLVAATGSGGTALSAAGEIICPARTKLFVLQNSSAYQVTLKTASGSGIAVAAGDTAFLFCDGTNVNACVTQIINGHITGNLTVDGNTTLGNSTSDTITANARVASDLNPSADNTYDLGTAGNSWRNLYIDGTATIATLNVTTIDTTNLEVTNIKAKDGTASITLADSTGVATLSANPVLNAGTANGVVYLNGSKSATSGNALYFDGASLGVGTTTPIAKLHVNTSSATQTLVCAGNMNGGAFFGELATGLPAIGGYGTTHLKFGSFANPSLAFTEYMVLDSSGNLGLGATPSAWSGFRALDIGGYGSFAGYTVSGYGCGLFANTYYNGSNYIYKTTNSAMYMDIGSSGFRWYQAGSGTAGNPISFTQAMTLDSSGNLGLGVTPSAWNTTALQLTNGASFSSLSGGYTFVSNNFYYNAGSKYIGTGAATLYQQNAGVHAWYTAPSGTAGNAISFTTAMALDASSNLTVLGSGYFNGSVAGQGAYITREGSTGGAVYSAQQGLVTITTPGTNPITFQTSSTERMRIDSSGNVGIGSSSPAYTAANRTVLYINGTTSSLLGFAYGGTNAGYIYNDATDTTFWVEGSRNMTLGVASAGLIAFRTNNIERMRIDSSGNVQLSTAGTKVLNSSGRPILNQSGSILQVVSTASSSAFSTSSGAPQATGLSVTITPASTSSKVLVLVTGNGRATAGGGSNCYIECWLYRSGTQIWHGFAQAGNFGSTDLRGRIGIEFLDSPATTSAMTYQLYIGSSFAAAVYLNNSGGTSTITAMEVSA